MTSPLLIGELPSSLGFIGVLFIVVGTYFLSIRDVRFGYFAPFKALMNEKGVVLVLIVAFIFSIAINLMKMGMQHSNPLFFALVFNLSVSIALFPIMATKSKRSIKKIRSNVKSLFVIGLLHALMDIFILNAMELAFVTYVNSVKRTSIIFSTLFGYFFFHEQRIIERLSGASIMIIGILLISFA